MEAYIPTCELLSELLFASSDAPCVREQILSSPIDPRRGWERDEAREGPMPSLDEYIPTCERVPLAREAKQENGKQCKWALWDDGDQQTIGHLLDAMPSGDVFDRELERYWGKCGCFAEEFACRVCKARVRKCEQQDHLCVCSGHRRLCPMYPSRTPLFGPPSLKDMTVAMMQHMSLDVASLPPVLRALVGDGCCSSNSWMQHIQNCVAWKAPCSYCGQFVPRLEWQKHMDHHFVHTRGVGMTCGIAILVDKKDARDATEEELDHLHQALQKMQEEEVEWTYEQGGGRFPSPAEEWEVYENLRLHGSIRTMGHVGIPISVPWKRAPKQWKTPCLGCLFRMDEDVTDDKWLLMDIQQGMRQSHTVCPCSLDPIPEEACPKEWVAICPAACGYELVVTRSLGGYVEPHDCSRGGETLCAIGRAVTEIPFPTLKKTLYSQRWFKE